MVRTLLGWLRPDHFSVDLLYLDCLSRVRTLNQRDQESRDFKVNSANRTALRNGLKFRNSVARIHAIALPLLAPAKPPPNFDESDRPSCPPQLSRPRSSLMSVLSRLAPLPPFRRPRGIVAFALSFGISLGLALVLTGCAPDHGHDELQIRQRLADVAAAIRQRDVDGILRWGTPDWMFSAPDGQTYSRTSYAERTGPMLANLVSVDALSITVQSFVWAGDDLVDLRNLVVMERHEKDPAGGPPIAVRLTYPEHQLWLRTDDGWRVRRVEITAPAERIVLP